MAKMRITEVDIETKNFIMDVAEVVARRINIERGEEDRYISQRKAERIYGQRQVREWIKRGAIRLTKNGMNNSKIQIDRIELEATSKASK